MCAALQEIILALRSQIEEQKTKDKLGDAVLNASSLEERGY